MLNEELKSKNKKQKAKGKIKASRQKGIKAKGIKPIPFNANYIAWTVFLPLAH
jgi:hypothetical protein